MAVLCLGAGPWQCQLPARDDAGVAAIADAGLATAGEARISREHPGRIRGPLPIPSSRPPPETPAVQSTPRREESTGRETYGDKKPPPRSRLSYPDEVVVRVLRLGQSSFLGCWKRALRADPTLEAPKARLYLEIDAFGVVQSSRTDVEDEKLSRCLAMVGRRLAFPPLGEPVVLELPLLF